MIPSIMISHPGPEVAKQPQTITLPPPCLTWYDVLFMKCFVWFYYRYNGTHTPSKSSTFVTSVHKIFSQKSWKKIKLFFGKCETSLCVLFGQQWLLPRFCPVSCLLLIMNTRGAMDRR